MKLHIPKVVGPEGVDGLAGSLRNESVLGTETAPHGFTATAQEQSDYARQFVLFEHRHSRQLLEHNDRPVINGIDKLHGKLERGLDIVELGGGTGRFADNFHNTGYTAINSYLLAEPNAELAATARRRTGCKVVEQSALTLLNTLRHHRVDAVVSVLVAHLLDSDALAKFTIAIHESLRSGGEAFITVPHPGREAPYLLQPGNTAMVDSSWSEDGVNVAREISYIRTLEDWKKVFNPFFATDLRETQLDDGLPGYLILNLKKCP